MGGLSPDLQDQIGESELHDDHLVVTARDGLQLKVGAYPAPGDGPVVLISHGIASHMGWYRPLAQELRGRGLSVYTPDRRGTGLSQGSRGHMPSWRLVVDDLQRVADEVARRHPGRPLHLLGISLGAVFSAGAVLDRPERYASLLASAPGFVARFKLPLRRRLRVLKRSFLDPERLYDLPFGMSTLTDREDWQQVLRADPLRTRKVTARFLVEMFRMQKATGRELGLLKLPLLVYLAGDDELIDNEAVLGLLTRSDRPSRPGQAVKRVEIFEGASHILPASQPRAAFCDALQNWFVGGYQTVGSGLEVVPVPQQSVPKEELPPPPSLRAGSP